ncbi:MAG: RNB domain-containing ribonuclease [Treponema sp.]|jgi:exoribonuclease-2|nr:RNB domain-containing ribonuclease [Treponema sp.]
MFREKSLVAYKAKPALVTAIGDKIDISLPGGEKLRVREKDIEMIHPGPASSPEEAANPLSGDVRGAWELLSDTLSPGSSVPLRELAELAYGEFSPQSAWAAFTLLKEGLYFSGAVDGISPRDAAAVETEERKRDGKQRDAEERGAFLQRLRTNTLILPKAGDSPDSIPAGRYTEPPGGGPSDLHFFQDVEALAYGKSEKSRTLKELGRPENPEEAHRLLLSTGVWTPWVNPYPPRFGLSTLSAREPVPPPPEEARVDLTGLRAYAIDNAYSADPDDAVSIEGPDSEGRLTLYVHVADPASSVLPNSPADLEARGRGATLYLPEGPVRMLADKALSDLALGLSETSPALTFRLTIEPSGVIAETGIFPSTIKVTRLTYQEADRLVKASGAISEDLAALFSLSEGNTLRRLKAGAVMIDLPEVHMAVDREARRITVEPGPPSAAADMVRECMLLAGEGAARWASRQILPFPYVCQETGDLPNEPLPGLAGSYQLRRCMRPRTLSVKPGLHWGLGLDQYTQVTSPLRRYTDLLAHQQIRSALKTGLYADRDPLTEEEVLLALSAGEAASLTTVHAERASRNHWLAAYLADKRDSPWEAVVLEKKGHRGVMMIPALGLETQVPLKTGTELNELVCLRLVSVKIPQGEAVFVIE